MRLWLALPAWLGRNSAAPAWKRVSRVPIASTDGFTTAGRCTGRTRAARAAAGSTDYPLADIDLSIRLSELTKTRVSFDGGGQPNHLIVQLTSDELFQCPVIITQEVGRLLFTREDAAQLKNYLLKGGFLWVDDFWGSYAWQVWEEEIRKVFPSTEYPIVDVPRDHPLFHMLFDLEGVPQIPGIGTFLAGRTSERGADSDTVHTRTISDSHGRVMVFMTHNTDVSDSWEREGEDPEVLPAILRGRLPRGDQCVAVRDDPLTTND